MKFRTLAALIISVGIKAEAACSLSPAATEYYVCSQVAKTVNGIVVQQATGNFPINELAAVAFNDFSEFDAYRNSNMLAINPDVGLFIDVSTSLGKAMLAQVMLAKSLGLQITRYDLQALRNSGNSIVGYRLALIQAK